jgi:hypothetical protein
MSDNFARACLWENAGAFFGEAEQAATACGPRRSRAAIDFRRGTRPRTSCGLTTVPEWPELFAEETIMEKEFEAATREEAIYLADKWWKAQKAFTLVTHYIFAGAGAPVSGKTTPWKVLIHYEKAKLLGS